MAFSVFVLSFSKLRAQEPLTLRQCIDFALENNYSLQKSKIDVQKARMAKGEILGALLPQINGQAQMTRSVDLMSLLGLSVVGYYFDCCPGDLQSLA